MELYQDYGTQSKDRVEGYNIRRRPLSTSASISQQNMAPQEFVQSTNISLFVYLRSVVCIQYSDFFLGRVAVCIALSLIHI